MPFDEFDGHFRISISTERLTDSSMTRVSIRICSSIQAEIGGCIVSVTDGIIHEDEGADVWNWTQLSGVEEMEGTVELDNLEWGGLERVTLLVPTGWLPCVFSTKILMLIILKNW